ncbi:hypothetical protein NG796_18980 [Laspinema sp. A4]|uniref:hypothetical protein n=1 Tax=Laspinema sp. D2d TaxID=2953686 RepID=UPI0021BB2540|nr:hypothetical protein [Laspinema sp. D2d]MCT7985361.1 hypothetical protein [Laspinema sp. D2d]
MNEQPSKSISEIFEERTLIDRALKVAANRAFLLHTQLGRPIVVWQDGKIVKIPPEEICVDEEYL